MGLFWGRFFAKTEKPKIPKIRKFALFCKFRKSEISRNSARAPPGVTPILGVGATDDITPRARDRFRCRGWGSPGRESGRGLSRERGVSPGLESGAGGDDTRARCWDCVTSDDEVMCAIGVVGAGRLVDDSLRDEFVRRSSDCRRTPRYSLCSTRRRLRRKKSRAPPTTSCWLVSGVGLVAHHGGERRLAGR